MRYLSLIFIVFCMYWSWAFIESPTAVPEMTHALIQDDLKQIISEKIQEDLPVAQKIEFDRFWTQNLKNGKIKASFLVSFDIPDIDAPTRHGIQGHYILNLDPQTNRWTGDGTFEFTEITFQNGLVIEPSGESKKE